MKVLKLVWIPVIVFLISLPNLVLTEAAAADNAGHLYEQEEISSEVVFGCARGGYYIDRYVYSDGYSVSIENERFGFIDQAGGLVIPHTYAYARNFSEGLAAVQSADSHKWGYINKQGEVVIPLAYDRAEPFSDGRGAVKDSKTGKWGFVDSNGKVVIPFTYEDVNLFAYGTTEAQKNGLWGIIDPAGKTIVPFKFTEAPVFGDCVKSPYRGEYYTFRLIDHVAHTNTVSMFSKPGKKFIVQGADSILSPEDGLIRVERNNKFGYVDLSGKAVIPLKYDQLEPFSEGLALAGIIDLKAGYPKYGYINREGKTVIPLIYGRGEDFSEGLAAVGVKFLDAQGLWEMKLIDPAGRTIKGGLNYISITKFLNGKAVVDRLDPSTKLNKYGMINTSGQIVTPLEYDQYDITVDPETGKEDWVLTKNEPSATTDTGYQPVPSGMIDSHGNVIEFAQTPAPAPPVGVLLNGERIALQPAAKVINGSTFIPLRGVLEKMGAKVQFNSADQSIDITQGSTTIHLKMNSKSAKVNGKAVQLSTAPFVDKRSSSTYVPLRFISETLGAKVSWVAEESLALIES
ncbi:MAG: WG repeat-containing protein [Paenibacillaceae bacterium]|nr:WG repeat-containing protein [Paenibacillaceae bacterium]